MLLPPISAEIARFSETLYDDTCTSPYDINSGKCSELADYISYKYSIALCTCYSLELHADFRSTIMNTLSSSKYSEDPYSIIIRINHDWCFDENTGLHYDSEAPDGVLHIDNLPIFNRMLAPYRRD